MKNDSSIEVVNQRWTLSARGGRTLAEFHETESIQRRVLFPPPPPPPPRSFARDHIKDHRAFDSVTHANFRYHSARMLAELAREERNENDTRPLFPLFSLSLRSPPPHFRSWYACFVRTFHHGFPSEAAEWMDRCHGAPMRSRGGRKGKGKGKGRERAERTRGEKERAERC